MKEEILNYMYELIETIKEQDLRIIEEFSCGDEDLKENEQTYKTQRRKAEELVNKLN